MSVLVTVLVSVPYQRAGCYLGPESIALRYEDVLRQVDWHTWAVTSVARCVQYSRSSFK